MESDLIYRKNVKIMRLCINKMHEINEKLSTLSPANLLKSGKLFTQLGYYDMLINRTSADIREHISSLISILRNDGVTCESCIHQAGRNCLISDKIVKDVLTSKLKGHIAGEAKEGIEDYYRPICDNFQGETNGKGI